MRGLGGFIGATPSPTFAGAGGVWTLREAAQYRAGGRWPINGLICNLDASALSSLRQNSNGTTAASATDDPVGYWADQTGLGNHATQATSGSRPVLKLNNQNGLPGIQTAASQGFITASVASFNTLASATVVIVAKTPAAAAADTNNGFLWFFGNAGTASGTYPADTAFFLAHSTGDLSGEFLTLGLYPLVSGSRQSNRLGSTSYRRAANSPQTLVTQISNSGVELFANNAAVTLDLNTANGSTTTPCGPADIRYTADNDLHFSAFRSGGTLVASTQVTYHQILVFNRALSSSERSGLHSQLAAKWGIT